MTKSEDRIVEEAVDKLPVFPAEPLKDDRVVPPMPPKNSKISIRNRLHYWLCGRLGVVPLADFNELFYMTDELGVLVFRKNKVFSDFVKVQHEFNVLINDKLRLDIRFEKENDERGVYV